MLMKPKSGSKVASDLVEERDGKFFNIDTNEELKQIVAKMFQDPEKCLFKSGCVVKKYACELDPRLYECSLGPFEMIQNSWTDQNIKGVYNFPVEGF